MPWKCPACGSQIRHSDLDDRPRLGERYRCHICRLDLKADPETKRLIVAPLRSDEPELKTRKTV
jgi:hypothetical protein